MKFLRKKILWYMLYGISITVVFLYLLFPGDLVKSKLENSANSADFNIKSSSLRASFPLGVKLKNVTLSSSAFEHGPFFQGESLDLQYSLLNLIRKNIYFGLSGR